MPYLYDDHGCVSDWGAPNITHLTINGHEPAWKTWKVTVWWKRTSHHWHEHLIFYVERFRHVPQHYNRYVDTSLQGRTDRVVFEVELWIWSESEGWEYKDYM